MGHAIYSVSDPRAQVLKGFIRDSGQRKGRMKEYNLYAMVENGSGGYHEERHIYKGVSANVVFYSGFCLQLVLDLPLSCIHRFLQWHVLWAGAPTEWKN